MKENRTNSSLFCGEHLELCCGKAKLVLTRRRHILNGTHIHLEGESDVNGDAPVINWNCGATQPVPDAPVPGRNFTPRNAGYAAILSQVQKIKTELVQ